MVSDRRQRVVGVVTSVELGYVIVYGIWFAFTLGHLASGPGHSSNRSLFLAVWLATVIYVIVALALTVVYLRHLSRSNAAPENKVLWTRCCYFWGRSRWATTGCTSCVQWRPARRNSLRRGGRMHVHRAERHAGWRTGLLVATCGTRNPAGAARPAFASAQACHVRHQRHRREPPRTSLVSAVGLADVAALVVGGAAPLRSVREVGSCAAALSCRRCSFSRPALSPSLLDVAERGVGVPMGDCRFAASGREGRSRGVS